MLYPAKLPRFMRYGPGAESAHLVQWFWVPRWQLPAGESVRQEILPFPAANLTIADDGVSLTGPSTRLIHKVLAGTGWALGCFCSAGLAALGVHRLVDTVVDWPGVVPDGLAGQWRRRDAAIDLDAHVAREPAAPPQRAVEADRLCGSPQNQRHPPAI